MRDKDKDKKNTSTSTALGTTVRFLRHTHRQVVLCRNLSARTSVSSIHTMNSTAHKSKHRARDAVSLASDKTFDISSFPRMKTHELAAPALFFRESSVTGSLAHRSSLRSNGGDSLGPGTSAFASASLPYSARADPKGGATEAYAGH